MAFSLDVQDINGDGQMDVVSNYSFFQPEIYLNEGDFTFNGPGEIQLPTQRNIENEYALIDFDQDGDLDPVIYYTSNGARVSVVRNDDGSFSEELVIQPDLFAGAIEIFDANKNGMPGLLTGYGMTFLDHQGGFNFDLEIGSSNNYFEQILFEDIDGNLIQDAIMYDHALDIGGLFFFRDLQRFVEVIDVDNDGYPVDEDCDDMNANINPGADEVPNNDIDENCDGIKLIIDVDMDGYNSDEDCDDDNAEINPDAYDIPGNDLDEDCNGEDAIILNYPVFSIPQVKSLDENGFPINFGALCSVTGVVHGINFFYSANGVFTVIVDESGEGIWLFTFEPVNYDVKIGDQINVQGNISQFNGLVELQVEQITLLQENQSLVNPKTISELNEESEGDFVQLLNLDYVDKNQWKGNGESFIVLLTDGENEFSVRIDDDTEMSSMAAPVAPFHLKGLGAQFDNVQPYTEGYQLYPRFFSDFEVTTSVEKINHQKYVHIYPNPAHNRLTIMKSDLLDDDFKILDIWGKVIRTGRGSQVALEGILPGIYFISIGRYFKRFIKL